LPAPPFDDDGAPPAFATAPEELPTSPPFENEPPAPKPPVPLGSVGDAELE
jgi:hypothetical protein